MELDVARCMREPRRAGIDWFGDFVGQGAQFRDVAFCRPHQRPFGGETLQRAPDLEGGIEALIAERAQLLAAMREGDGLALGTIEWPHPAVGVLNIYQWLVFLGAHEGRHAEQLREIAIAFAPRD